MRLVSSAALCLLLFSSLASAAIVSGIVTDEEGIPMPGVRITVASDKSQVIHTGKNGEFTIAVPGADFIIINAELSGFAPAWQQVQHAGSKPITLIMKPRPFGEQVVVSASRAETPLLSSPAGISVVDGGTLRISAGQNYADLLRNVPGLNAMQTTNRAVSLTSRAATEVVAASQLVLLDGRTLYLDFGGFVFWDFLPIHTTEIKQVEVVRGPASAVWGANAQTGVINIRTLTPRETPGINVILNAGIFGRNPDSEDGVSAGAYARYSGILSDRTAYKVSIGYFHSDPFARPEGAIPIDHVPGTNIRTGGTPYSFAAYENLSTNQPRVDARIDHDFGNGSSITCSGGLAATEGIIIARTGPFHIKSGTKLGYGRAEYSKGNLKASLFTNILDGSAANLFGITGADGNPVSYSFKSQSYNFDMQDSLLLGQKHLLTFGGNFRHSDFDITLTPHAEDRNETGAYIQDEFATGMFRWILGGRIDTFSSIDHPVFSPRVSAIFSPVRNHAFRISYNRAFRIPTVQDNYTDLAILNSVRLPGQEPFRFPTRVVGNPNLNESVLTAWEAGYTGEWMENTTISASVYINDVRDSYALRPGVFYSSAMPPPGWALPAELVPPNALPARFDFRNIAQTIRNKGIELEVQHKISRRIDFFSNYSYQTDPEILNGTPNQLPNSNFPPHHRFNVGFQYNSNRFFGGAWVNAQSRAFWIDVLDARFWGPTDPFTTVSATLGVRWREGRVTTSVKANNLLNHPIQQHVFGDIIKRSIVGELSLSL